MKNAIFLFVLVIISSSSFALDRNQIAESAEEITPLLVGQKVPDKVLWSTLDEPIRLRSLVSHKPTILLFYRGGWCPFCNFQLSQIQKIQHELKSLGYQLIAVSPDKPDDIEKIIQLRQFGYHIYSDYNLRVSKAFGIVFHISEEYAEKIKTTKFTPPKFEGDTRYALPVPSVFIVDQEGVIQFEYINPNYKVRIEPELLLVAAKLALKEPNTLK